MLEPDFFSHFEAIRDSLLKLHDKLSYLPDSRDLVIECERIIDRIDFYLSRARIRLYDLEKNRRLDS